MTLWRRLRRFFHRHEWLLVVERNRLYLICATCPATSPGVALRPGERIDDHDLRRRLDGSARYFV